jgi:hypothetical protein
MHQNHSGAAQAAVTEEDTETTGGGDRWRTEAWAGCDCCEQMGESGELGSSKGQSEAGLRPELDGNGVVYLSSQHWDSRRFE